MSIKAITKDTAFYNANIQAKAFHKTAVKAVFDGKENEFMPQ